MSMSLAARLLLACLTLLPFHVEAQLFRAYLASGGNDANPCTLQAPCRLMPAALAAVADKGEIWLMDSANFNTGPVNVTKSVSILAIPGEMGSVVAVAGSSALVIATAGVNVKLKNLSIQPIPGAAALDAIVMTQGASLTIQACNIAGFTGKAGVLFNVPNGRLRIVDSTLSDNLYGLQMLDGGASVTRVQFFGNAESAVGVQSTVAGANARVAIDDSVLSGSNVAAWAQGFASGSTARISLSRSQLSHSAYGIGSSANAGSVAVVSVADSHVSHNTTPYLSTGVGSIETLGNNHLRHNGVDVGTMTAVPLR